MAAPPSLLLALRDPSAEPRAASAEAHATFLLRSHVLARIASALHEAGLEALLVKGAALALTVYASPAARLMSDIDLLVRRADRDRVVAALVRAGGHLHALPDRPLSRDMLGETAVMMQAGALSLLVEVHTSLDKVVPRPVDERALFGRARQAPGLPGLLVPSPEDHTLLIALHAAGHGFRHPIALLDLELLLRRGLDLDALAERARAWKLRTVMFAAMASLERLGAASVTAAHVAAFDPGSARRALVARFLDAATSLDHAGDDALGLPWILGQIPLRDDLGAWALGVGRYAAVRARERIGIAHGEHRASAEQRAAPTMVTEQASTAVGERTKDAAARYRVPLWVKVLLAADRVAMRATSVREGLRDELLLAWIRPEDRAALTGAIYADQATYLPGGYRFQSGLFPWEKRVFDSPLFPSRGRVLLGAAGAGRELVALIERGFDVVAFDPCAPFADAARSVADPARATVLHASYGDLVDAAGGRGGPLATVIAEAPIDAVVLGWGSLSHVLPSRERSKLLRAVRAVAPKAPLLTSFAVEGDTATPLEQKGRVRDTLRRLFAALDAPGVSEGGDHFFQSGGFFAYLGRDEIVRLAWEAGYEVALYEDSPYPHAVLVPLDRAADALASEGKPRAG